MATLLGEDVTFVFVTNGSYELDPLGYRFAAQGPVTIEAPLPGWLAADSVTQIGWDGARPVRHTVASGRVRVELPGLPDQVALIAVRGTAWEPLADGPRRRR